MLSYRHAFHAGNFADVLKHCALTLTLEYMTKKEKGFSYIDSHSGAGMYSLLDDKAQKTGEFKEGIAKLINNQDLPEDLRPYIHLVQTLNENGDLMHYPGSPGFAKHILRRQDSAHLYELHSTDIQLLEQFCQHWRKANVNKKDGYKGVLSQLPPPTRRGVVLIDPPYELKEDYTKAVDTIIKGYDKFAGGTYILWYPVVTRDYILNMEKQFLSSKVKNLIQVELCMQPDTEQYGMTGTGLFIVNPPWQLQSQLNDILPYLKNKMGNKNTSYSISQLIEE